MLETIPSLEESLSITTGRCNNHIDILLCIFLAWVAMAKSQRPVVMDKLSSSACHGPQCTRCIHVILWIGPSGLMLASTPTFKNNLTHEDTKTFTLKYENVGWCSNEHLAFALMFVNTTYLSSKVLWPHIWRWAPASSLNLDIANGPTVQSKKWSRTWYFVRAGESILQ